MGCISSSNSTAAAADACKVDEHREWRAKKGMSTSEFEKMIREIFDHCDEKSDGILLIDEFKQFTLHILEACEGLELLEHDEEMSAMFERFDVNKDGKLDWTEIWACIQPLQAVINAQ